MFNKKNELPISDLLSDFLNSNPKIKVSLAEHRAISAWKSLLGEGVSQYTKNLYFKRNILYVQLTSSVLRAELMMNKKSLIERINEQAGMEVVKEIVLR